MSQFIRPGALLLACCLFVPAATQAQDNPRAKQRPQTKQRQTRPQERSARGDRWPDKVKPGDQAVDFTLKTLDGKQSYKLSDFQGKQPVALIFGSYT